MLAPAWSPGAAHVNTSGTRINTCESAQSTTANTNVTHFRKRRTPKCFVLAATGAHVSCTIFLASGVRSGMVLSIQKCVQELGPGMVLSVQKCMQELGPGMVLSVQKCMQELGPDMVLSVHKCVQELCPGMVLSVHKFVQVLGLGMVLSVHKCVQ